MTGKETGTVFTRSMTNQKNPGAIPKITMLSPEGEKLAALSAPCDAFEIYKSSTAACKEE
jgi:hypothetical protein